MNLCPLFTGPYLVHSLHLSLSDFTVITGGSVDVLLVALEVSPIVPSLAMYMINESTAAGHGPLSLVHYFGVTGSS